jgi:hypothetical protein
MEIIEDFYYNMIRATEKKKVRYTEPRALHLAELLSEYLEEEKEQHSPIWCPTTTGEKMESVEIETEDPVDYSALNWQEILGLEGNKTHE